MLLRKIFKIVFFSFLIWLFVRAFIFQTFLIPSASMHGALFEGDYVVINKLVYGARMPITPLSFSFGGQKKYLDLFHLPYMRLPGYGSVQRNDILAFNFSLTDELPLDMREEFVKRCAGLPGDSLQIKNGRVYVNGEPEDISTIYKHYTVISAAAIDDEVFKKLKIVPDDNAKNNNYSLNMSADQAAALLKTGLVVSLTADLYKSDYYHPSVFPNNSNVKWNPDFFGPLWIPKKGDSILLDKKNLAIFRHTIEKCEKTSIEQKDSLTFVDGKAVKYYQFKQNYFFVLGDNRQNSIDSRFSGLIPEDHVIGKASLVFPASRETKWHFLPTR